MKNILDIKLFYYLLTGIHLRDHLSLRQFLIFIISFANIDCHTNITGGAIRYIIVI